jgi:hypothetical protein
MKEHETSRFDNAFLGVRQLAAALVLAEACFGRRQQAGGHT